MAVRQRLFTVVHAAGSHGRLKTRVMEDDDRLIADGAGCPTAWHGAVLFPGKLVVLSQGVSPKPSPAGAAVDNIYPAPILFEGTSALFNFGKGSRELLRGLLNSYAR